MSNVNTRIHLILITVAAACSLAFSQTTPERQRNSGVVRNAVLIMHGTAQNILLLMGSAPLHWHKQAPTRDAADKFYEERVKSGVMRSDANDMLYYFDSSREYNPSH